MIDNGFTPEWIQLSKEIREETQQLKRKLRNTRNELGNLPLSTDEEFKWKNSIHKLMDDATKINSKIDKYNLLVPILQKQMLQINLETMANEALAVPPDKTYVKANSSNANNREPDLVQLITSIFGK